MRKCKTKSKSKHKADRYFSKYIRERDANYAGIATCITCGRATTDFDAGHFISRRYLATRYDERNCNAQCMKCNRFESGRQYEHGLAIDVKYGEGTAKELLGKSQTTTRFTQMDFEEIAKKYKDKL